jgi:drug/metabolite transporter (DMT)-like permease
MLVKLKNFNSFIVLSTGAMLIGFAPIFVKWSSLSPSWILFYRMLLALPMLLMLNLILNKTIIFKFKSSISLYMSALASMGFTIDLIIWHWSMNITSVSNATIIVNSAPIFVAILAYIFYNEQIKSKFLLSFLITYGGIVGLIYYSNSYEAGKLHGDLAVIIAAISYAIYLLILSRLGDEDPFVVIFYTTLFCCLYSIPIGLVESGIQVPPNTFDWLNFFLLAFLCQFGGQFLITIGIGNISNSMGAIGLLMQPITATILAAYFFNEFLNIMQIIFIFIALFGIYLAKTANN